MSDTPETIAAVEASDGQWSFVLKQTCAKLERERDQWKADCLEQCKLLAMSADREEKLRAALQRLADCDWVISLPDRMDAVRKIAREALQ